MKSEDWCLSLKYGSVDAKLCQQSVAAPFPWTVYSARSVHKLSSWESGLYWLKVGRVYVLLEYRWFRPSFCGHGNMSIISCACFTDRGNMQFITQSKDLFLNDVLTTEITSCLYGQMDLASSCYIRWLFKEAALHLSSSQFVVFTWHHHFRLSDTETDTNQWSLMDCDGH